MSTLAQSVYARRGTSFSRYAFKAILAVVGSLFIAGLAQVTIHLSFTPVPITGQTLGVLLVGAAFGPSLGAATLLLYLLEGALGLPFFAHGAHGWSLLQVASATGGYLWGFVVAAAVVGWLSTRGWDRSLKGSIGSMFVGELVLYAIAVPWLAHSLGIGVQRAMVLGLYPFIVGDTLKLLIAAGALPLAWRFVRGGERQRAS
jgi:biotin transport system substrate-specific component